MKKFWCLLGLLILMTCWAPISGQAVEPDVIHQYTVTITPQKDGVLVMKYDFDYEATTDFPNGSAYLEIGVPNSNFEIVSYEPKDFISGARAITSSSSKVHLDFNRLPLKGDKFQFSFSIRQGSMIYKNDEGYSFQFVPGWFDFARIETLKVVIQLDGLTIKKIEPEPSTKSDGQAIFLTNNLDVNQKADKLTILTDKESFSIKEEELTQESNDSSVGIVFLVVIGIIILIVLIVGLVYYFSSDGDYDGGSYAGGYSGSNYSSGSYFGSSDSSSHSHSSGYSGSIGSSRSSGGSSSSGGHSSFGGGGFSGRGSSCVTSCACVSCACACAGGGGRAGCSEKGYRVLRLIIEGYKRERGKVE